MTRKHTTLALFGTIAALAGAGYAGYLGYQQYKKDPRGFKKRTRRFVEDAVDAYDSVKERVRR